MKLLKFFALGLLPCLAHSVQAVTLADLTARGCFPPPFSEPGHPDPKTLVYRTHNGQELQLYVFKPETASPQSRRPAIVFIHGGGWKGGDPRFFFPHARYFAGRGIVAISIQYRLLDKGAATIFDCLTDCKSALRFIRENADSLGIDQNRIAVVGDSAGGHLAAALAMIKGFDNPADNPAISPVPNALLLYNPALDLTHPKHVKAMTPAASNHGPEPAALAGLTPAERARMISPLGYIAAGQPPVFLMHGRDDPVVPVEQSERFAELYRTAGNRCELQLPEGVRHAFVLINYYPDDEVVVNAIRAGDEFLSSLGYLQGQPTLRLPEP